MNDWISVKDRLPALDEEVLVYVPDGTDGFSAIAYRDTYSGKFFDAFEFARLAEEPTHWMPLPAPPENE